MKEMTGQAYQVSTGESAAAPMVVGWRCCWRICWHATAHKRTVCAFQSIRPVRSELNGASGLVAVEVATTWHHQCQVCWSFHRDCCAVKHEYMSRNGGQITDDDDDDDQSAKVSNG
jgi:hypothetical protein